MIDIEIHVSDEQPVRAMTGQDPETQLASHRDWTRSGSFEQVHRKNVRGPRLFLNMSLMRMPRFLLLRFWNSSLESNASCCCKLRVGPVRQKT